MAPEQFQGKATYASDVYSIGCILYEMIIGRPPIFDPDPFKILERAQEGKITPPRLKNMSIPRELDAVIMTCLASKVEERYQKPSEVIRALAEIRGEKPHRSEIEDILGRIRARDASSPGPCWNCRRPLPPRTRVCPHCGESA
jgi:serine/threonine protein kinase